MRKPSWFSITFFKEWALWTLSLASGGPTVIFTLIFFFQGKDPPKTGPLTVLGACSLVAAWIAGLRERRLRIQAQKTLEAQITDLENRIASPKPKVILEFRGRSESYTLPSLAAVNVKSDDACRISLECDQIPRL